MTINYGAGGNGGDCGHTSGPITLASSGAGGNGAGDCGSFTARPTTTPAGFTAAPPTIVAIIIGVLIGWLIFS